MKGGLRAGGILVVPGEELKRFVELVYQRHHRLLADDSSCGFKRSNRKRKSRQSLCTKFLQGP